VSTFLGAGRFIPGFTDDLRATPARWLARLLFGTFEGNHAKIV